MNSILANAKPYTNNPVMEGFTENYFETKDGTKLRFLHKGEGMPLILLHGYGDDADAWMLNAPEFAKHYSVFCLDQRGHGYSYATYGARIHRLSADVAEMIDAIGEPKVNLCGHSMGCAVIWGYLDCFGYDRVNKLIFTDEPLKLVANPYDTMETIKREGSNPMDAYILPRAVETAGTLWAPGSPFFDGFSACFRNAHPAYSDMDLFMQYAEKLPDNYLELMSQRPAPCDNVPRKFMANLLFDHLVNDWVDLAPTIKRPVLFMSGDISHATTIELGEYLMKTVPDIKWVRFTEEEFAMHEFFQSSYKKYNKVVLDFLAD